MSSRRQRGRDTERALAAWLRDHGHPHAEPCAPFAPGPDILGTPGWAIEVKARARLDLPAWLKQAHRQATGARPLLVVRLNGQGTTDPGAWAAITTLHTWQETTRDT
jgi:Holliday junction resolvase